MTTKALKQYEELLSPADFVRIHRGYIVALRWIQSFDQHHVYGPGLQLPIGDVYRDVLSRSVRIITAQPAGSARRKRHTHTGKA